MEPELAILKPDELYLKSDPVMRNMMTRLAHNVKICLKNNDVSFDHIVKQRLSIYVYSDELDEVIRGVKHVFGISTIAAATEVGSQIETLKSVAEELAEDLKKGQTFAIRARRSDKTYTLTSKDLEEQIGAHVQARTGAKVSLTKPNLQINIDIVEKKALIYTDVHRGMGGLPVGVSGKVLVLMNSDSIDSALMMLKRGCEVVPAHFIDENQQRFVNACKQLDKYAYGSQIRPISVREKFSIKTSAKIAEEQGCKALVLECKDVPEELVTWKKDSKMPIFTPLICL